MYGLNACTHFIEHRITLVWRPPYLQVPPAGAGSASGQQRQLREPGQGRRVVALALAPARDQRLGVHRAQVADGRRIGQRGIILLRQFVTEHFWKDIFIFEAAIEPICTMESYRLNRKYIA